MKNKKAFTLAEALMFLLVGTMIIVASMPVLTRKHYQSFRAPHGKWVCKNIDGVKKSVALGDTNSPIPPDDSTLWKDGCDFPRLPDTVKKLNVKIVGGGAAGSKAALEFKQSGSTKPISIFPTCESSLTTQSSRTCENVYVAPAEGVYHIEFYSDRNVSPNLKYKSMTIKPDLSKNLYSQCIFSPLATENYHVVSFDMTLMQNDKLLLKYGEPRFKYEMIDKSGNKFSNDDLYKTEKYGDPSKGASRYKIKITDKLGSSIEQDINFCNGSDPVQIKDELGGVAYDKFPANFQTAGYSGRTKTLYVMRNNQEMSVMTVYGSLPPFYGFGDCQSVDSNCSKRYQQCTYNVYTEQGKSKIQKEDAFKRGDFNPGSVSISTGGNDIFNSNVTFKSASIAINGGCGGNAGQVVTTSIDYKSHMLLNADIGVGGEIGKKVNGVEGAGEATSYGAYTAQGGQGRTCPTNLGTGRGGDGQSTSFVNDRDSKGGKGGDGNVYGLLGSDKNKNYDGADGAGVGSGGGGGGLRFDYGKNGSSTVTQFANNVGKPKKGEDYELGNAGKGASGGIIVTW